MEQVNKLEIENFDKEVLREYDIRGVVGNNINQNTATWSDVYIDEDYPDDSYCDVFVLTRQ